MRAVACPSHASVMALSCHVSGDGLCGAGGMSRPHSAIRSRRKRALHEDDKVVHAAPTLANAPVASMPRRVMEGFITFRDYR